MVCSMVHAAFNIDGQKQATVVPVQVLDSTASCPSMPTARGGTSMQPPVHNGQDPSLRTCLRSLDSLVFMSECWHHRFSALVGVFTEWHRCVAKVRTMRVSSLAAASCVDFLERRRQVR